MLFSTDPLPSKSKTKCMLFSRDKSSDKVLNVRLNEDNLPWVSTAKHLGNHLSSKLNNSPSSPETKTDLLCKRAILFDKIHQVQQQFGYYEPKLVLQLLSIYSTAMYGSPLWILENMQSSPDLGTQQWRWFGICRIQPTLDSWNHSAQSPILKQSCFQDMLDSSTI